jgi:hypothetical protein
MRNAVLPAASITETLCVDRNVEGCRVPEPGGVYITGVVETIEP